MFKNIKFKSMGNEDVGKRTGNIYINLFCKIHPVFRIIDDYNILYRESILKKENITHNEDGIAITIPIQFLDLKEYAIVIKNPTTSISLLYEYEIEGYGLYIPNKTRGKLIIEIVDPNNYIGHSYIQHDKRTHIMNNKNNDIDTRSRTSIEFNIIS